MDSNEKLVVLLEQQIYRHQKMIEILRQRIQEEKDAREYDQRPEQP